MFLYIVLLLVASLILLGVYILARKVIPIEAPVYYTSVGLSFLLGIALPRFLAALDTFDVIVIYIMLIIIFALALTVIREKILLRGQGRVPADPENVFVGKKVGLFNLISPKKASPGPTFAEMMARQLEAISTANGEDVRPINEREPWDQEELEPENAAVSEIIAAHEVAGLTFPEPVSQPTVEEDNPDGETLEEDPEQSFSEAQLPLERVAAKDKTQYARALHGLFKALETRPPLELKARLTLRLAEVYRDLGQYWQAVEAIRTFLANAAQPPDGAILNSLIVTAATCQAIGSILQKEASSLVAYADLSEETRLRAAGLAGKLILQGGWQGEEISGNH